MAEQETGDIALYHKELDEVVFVKTEAQAEILKESGWSKAPKTKVAELEEAES